MCTTASLCMGVAILSARVDPSLQSDGKLRGAAAEVMRVAGTGHTHLSNKISKGANPSMQTGIDEILSHANIDLKTMGLVYKSYLITPQAGTASCSYTDGKPTLLQLAGEESPGLLYVPEHDFVPQSVIPEIMIPTQWSKETNVVAVLTCNGHSVMLANGKSMHGYGFFDPLSGELMSNMDRFEIQDLIKEHTKRAPLADLLVITPKPPKTQ